MNESLFHLYMFSCPIFPHCLHIYKLWLPSHEWFLEIIQHHASSASNTFSCTHKLSQITLALLSPRCLFLFIQLIHFEHSHILQNITVTSPLRALTFSQKIHIFPIMDGFLNLFSSTWNIMIQIMLLNLHIYSWYQEFMGGEPWAKLVSLEQSVHS